MRRLSEELPFASAASVVVPRLNSKLADVAERVLTASLGFGSKRPPSQANGGQDRKVLPRGSGAPGLVMRPFPGDFVVVCFIIEYFIYINDLVN